MNLHYLVFRTLPFQIFLSHKSWLLWHTGQRLGRILKLVWFHENTKDKYWSRSRGIFAWILCAKHNHLYKPHLEPFFFFFLASFSLLFWFSGQDIACIVKFLCLHQLSLKFILVPVSKLQKHHNLPDQQKTSRESTETRGCLLSISVG